MSAEAAVLQRIHQLALSAHDGAPDAMRAALEEIVKLAAQSSGDTPEPSDVPQTENQSL